MQSTLFGPCTPDVYFLFPRVVFSCYKQSYRNTCYINLEILRQSHFVNPHPWEGSICMKCCIWFIHFFRDLNCSFNVTSFFFVKPWSFTVLVPPEAYTHAFLPCLLFQNIACKELPWVLGSDIRFSSLQVQPTFIWEEACLVLWTYVTNFVSLMLKLVWIHTFSRNPQAFSYVFCERT